MTKKFWLVAGLFAVASFLLTPILWPYADGSDVLPGMLMSLFMIVGALSSIAFGLGVSFLIFGWSRMRAVEKGYGLTFWTFISVVWLLVSWWPHENLHRVYEGNYQALIAIEYAFHVTLYIAGAILVAYLFRTFLRSAPQSSLVQDETDQ